MLIGLIRHGRTAWNAEGRLQGRTDIPITDDAHAELSKLALPRRWQGTRLVSSTLARATETARLIAGREPDADPRLVEVDVGRWTGGISAELRADPESGFRDIEDWGWDYAPHGGESPRDIWARVAPALEALLADGRDTLIVSHRVVMRTLLARAHGWDFDGPAPFEIKRNRIYPLTLGSGPVLAPDGPPERLVPR